MAGRLEGKVAFITGAARGQGRAHALAMAKEGADIIAVDICRQIESNPYPLATPDDLAETERSVKELGRRVVARSPTCASAPSCAMRWRPASRTSAGSTSSSPTRASSPWPWVGPIRWTSSTRRRRPPRRDEHRGGLPAAPARTVVDHHHRIDRRHDAGHERQPDHGPGRRGLRVEQAGADRIHRTDGAAPRAR